MCIISQHIENPELNAPEGYTNKITHLCAESNIIFKFRI